MDRELLTLIDGRVDKKNVRQLRPGTFAQRTSDTTGLVTEDAGVTSMPVLVAGDLKVDPGDRVVMAEFGKDWVVLAALAPRWTSEIFWEYTFAGETTTSGSYVDIPGMPAAASRQFSKRSSSSSVIGDANISCYYTGGTTAELALAFTLTDVDTGDVYGPQRVAHDFTSANGIRLNFGGKSRLSSVPAGTYTVALRWRRVQGTGTVTTDANDSYDFSVREAAPAT
jgi:hypothetical protein